jgi:bifunctional UDP-N-acetylglucosamine pyrophosphorylase / glucosamine-1-phosphate N-acetyltransferase
MKPRQMTGAVPIVLAAGLGTRMRSRLPKVLHPLCGRPMLAYVLDAARTATGERPLVVISPATTAVRAAFADAADFCVQAVPRGTADAVVAALAAVADDVPDVVVLSGDVPLVDAALVAELVTARRESEAAMGLVAVDVDDPGRLGRVVRDARGHVQRIVEATDATADELGIGEINAGLYAFDAAWLRRRIRDVSPSPVSGELYLPELVTMARADDRAVVTLEVEDDGTLLGINDRIQLADAEVEMRLRINEAHMRAGVTIVDPATTFIDAAVVLDEDVRLEPFVMLAGRSRVGRDSVIRAGSQLFDTSIGERCVVWASVLESSIVEDDVRIGPYSHIRGGAHVEAGVQLGNFAEVKNSRIGRGTKSHHVSYLGDADVGADVNIGAGTITANFDGHRKHRTLIGDHAFIGTDTILRAPVSIGEGAITGAGSVVTHDVAPGATVVGVPARPFVRPVLPEAHALSPAGGADGADARPVGAGARPAALPGPNGEPSGRQGPPGTEAVEGLQSEPAPEAPAGRG